MSLLGKYRKEAEKEEATRARTKASTGAELTRVKGTARRRSESVPNKERRSPIVSFSVGSDLRTCLKAIRETKSINLSMWVEKKLREAVMAEFPTIAEQYLE